MQETWEKSTQSAQVALEVLTEDQISNPVRGLRQIFMRLSLYMLNAVCFEGREDLMAELTDSGHPPSGHQLTYSQAMHNLIDSMPTIFLVSLSLLSTLSDHHQRVRLLLIEKEISPFKAHKKARQSYLELRKYMEELRDSKMISIESKAFEEGNSILGTTA